MTPDPHDIITETLSFTREVRDRLRACGEPKGPLVERLLREHWGMPPRPDVSQRGRWKPGQDPRTGKR